MEIPDIQYTRSGDVAIAYQTFGDGPRNIVFVPMFSNLVFPWANSDWREMFPRLAGPGEVLVSSTVKDLVAGAGIEFEERGVHELKGVPGDWRLYSVVDA